MTVYIAQYDTSLNMMNIVSALLQEKAVSALRHFTTCFYKMKNGSSVPELQDSLINTYIENLRQSSETTRQVESFMQVLSDPVWFTKESRRMLWEGFALALGVLPKFMLNGYLAGIRFVRALILSIAETVGVKREGESNSVINESILTRLFHCCFKAMNDYTIDS
ncbi:tubulin-specific chaperone D-like isoform X1 [Dendronephthya gigantea]|uniref:tubulin-specific chaperone D-like isoform X1 n=1 Tax=Dendronephthya gigantea TaxID=151771 RepID=UPI00106DC627|nr:tubulin-specific chaperone D-like isoform X1 [Dendronephthya gigantea]